MSITEGLLWTDTELNVLGSGVTEGLRGGGDESTLRNMKILIFCKRSQRPHIYQRRHVFVFPPLMSLQRSECL